MRTKEKADIIWDGNGSVDIRAPDSFKNKTTGLCGTYNENPSDDFKDFEGVIQSSVQPFAKSYISDDCNEPAYSRFTCAHQCTDLYTDAFSPCQAVIDRAVYKEKCEMDACAVNETYRAKAVCAVLESYSKQCALNSITLDWRKPSLCSKY